MVFLIIRFNNLGRQIPFLCKPLGQLISADGPTMEDLARSLLERNVR